MLDQNNLVQIRMAVTENLLHVFIKAQNRQYLNAFGRHR